MTSIWAEETGREDLFDSIDETRVVVAILGGQGARASRYAQEMIERRRGPLEHRRLLAEAMIAAGDDAGAFGVLRALGSTTPTSELQWYAWARMLEILARQNEGGARTGTIVREITRLRASAGYGECTPCAARIDRVARAVGME